MFPHCRNDANSARIPAPAANAAVNKAKPEGKKQVKVKPEPGTKGGMSLPLTPTEKISKPSTKAIDRNPVIDQSSKFFLPMDSEMDETPTRKRPCSKADAQGQKKPIIELPRVVDGNLSSSKPEKVHDPKIDKPNDKRKSSDEPLTSTPKKKPKSVKSIVVKPPPNFEPVNESLVNGIDDMENLDDMFKNVDDAMLAEQYRKAASTNFDGWVRHGVKLVDRQYQLVHKIVLARMRLSVKFQIIFDKVNKHGKMLESKDADIKDKLEKLRSLGKEIKSFINF